MRRFLQSVTFHPAFVLGLMVVMMDPSCPLG